MNYYECNLALRIRNLGLIESFTKEGMKYVHRYMHKDVFKCPICEKMYPTDDIYWYPVKKIIPRIPTPWTRKYRAFELHQRWIVTCEGRCCHCETALGIHLGYLDLSNYGPLDKFLFNFEEKGSD